MKTRVEVLASCVGSDFLFETPPFYGGIATDLKDDAGSALFHAILGDGVDHCLA